MEVTPQTYVNVLLLLMTSLGCEAAHPAEEPLQDVLTALQFGDANAVFESHIWSVENPYCLDERFVSVLELARAGRSQAECGKLGTLSASEVDKLDDPSRLLLQVTRLVCENPELDCKDYANAVLVDTLEQSPLWKGTEYQIRKVFGEGDQAVAYVVVKNEKVSNNLTLRLRRSEGKWRITEGLLSPEGQ